MVCCHVCAFGKQTKQGLLEDIEEQIRNKQAAAITVKEQKRVEFEGKRFLTTIDLISIYHCSTVLYYQRLELFKRFSNEAQAVLNSNNNTGVECILFLPLHMTSLLHNY
jgi:hypothetical protein